MPDYLVLPNEATAIVAKRKLEANYLRYRSDWQNGNGYGRALKNLSGSPVDPQGKTDAQILDDANLVMPGEKSGELNEVDGFTLQWHPLEQRLTDSKYIILLPEPGALRDSLMQGVPTPNSIEASDESWFPAQPPV